MDRYVLVGWGLLVLTPVIPLRSQELMELLILYVQFKNVVFQQ